MGAAGRVVIFPDCFCRAAEWFRDCPAAASKWHYLDRDAGGDFFWDQLGWVISGWPESSWCCSSQRIYGRLPFCSCWFCWLDNDLWNDSLKTSRLVQTSRVTDDTAIDLSSIRNRIDRCQCYWTADRQTCARPMLAPTRKQFADSPVCLSNGGNDWTGLVLAPAGRRFRSADDCRDWLIGDDKCLTQRLWQLKADWAVIMTPFGTYYAKNHA